MLEHVLYIVKLLKWAFLSALFAGGCAFFAAELLPKTYESTAIVRVNDNQSGGITSFLEGLPSSGLLGIGKQPGGGAGAILVQVALSRDVLLKTSSQNRLDTVYKKGPKNLILKAMLKDISIQYDAGVLAFTVNSADSLGAYSVLDCWVENSIMAFDSLQKDIILSNSLFLQGRQVAALDSLRQARDSLIDFYRRNKLIDLDRQVQSSIDALAGLEKTIGEIAIEESYQAKVYGDSGSLPLMTKSRRIAVEQLRNNLLSDTSGQRLFLNPKDKLGLALEERRLQGNLSMYTQAYYIVMKEKIASEAKFASEVRSVQVIQKPYVPDWKVRPKRAVIAIAAFLVAMSFYILTAWFLAVYTGRLNLTGGGNASVRALINALFR